MFGLKLNLRAGESGVALRFPPQSKMSPTHVCPCAAGGFWKDSLMAEVMADKVRQKYAATFFGRECDQLSPINNSQHRLG